MSNYSTPGVYLQEKDQSDVVTPLGTSTGVIVGKAYKGPVNMRVLVSDNKAFINTFGAPVSGNSNEFDIYGALRFLKQSNRLYFTRTPGASDTYAGASIVLSATTAASTMTSAGIPVSATYATPGYENGFTLNTQNGPGIGDIEIFGNANSLVVAAQGPGAYGNDIAISLVTSAAFDTNGTILPSLSALALVNHGANWAALYDDSDAISATNATWKKVFRLNVYSKLPQQTSAVWTSASTPVETYLVSLDPTAKDANNKSLFIGNIINGVSSYIYVKTTSLTNTAIGLTSASQMTILPFQGGSSSLTASALTGAALTNAITSLYSNKQEVQASIFIGTGAKDQTTITALSNVAASRQDAVAVVQVDNSTDNTRAKIEAASDSLTFGSNPSYVIKTATFDQIYDSYTDKTITVPMAPAIAALFARNDAYGNVWDSPAGRTRGVIEDAVGKNCNLSDADIGILYDKCVNVTKKIPGVGHCLWTQRTAQRKNSALREIPVRRMLLYVENSIASFLQAFLFEPNNDRTRSRIKTLVDQFLFTVQAGEGLFSYNVVINDSNNTAQDIDNNQLNVDIYLQPTRKIEFIKLQAIVTASGVTVAAV